MQSSGPSAAIPFQITKKREVSSSRRAVEQIFMRSVRTFSHCASAPWFFALFMTRLEIPEEEADRNPRRGGLLIFEERDRMQIVFLSGENSRHARTRISAIWRFLRLVLDGSGIRRRRWLVSFLVNGMFRWEKGKSKGKVDRWARLL